MTGSIVGALLSLTVYGVYEDVSMAMRLHAMAADRQEVLDEDPSARIKAFAEQLKKQKEQ
jgi:hypothetical protein